MEIKDIEVGKIVFEVNVMWNERRKPCVQNISQLTIVSLPQINEFARSRFVNVLIEGSPTPVERDLVDKNVQRKNNYNLNRWFTSRDEADKYATRIFNGQLTYEEKVLVENSKMNPTNDTLYQKTIRAASEKIGVMGKIKSALSLH